MLVKSCIIASDDIRDVDLTKVHNLSGPIAVEGAEPGDCLVVDILDGARDEHMHLGLTDINPVYSHTLSTDAMGKMVHCYQLRSVLMHTLLSQILRATRYVFL
jgi:acetamidase/formamidase